MMKRAFLRLTFFSMGAFFCLAGIADLARGIPFQTGNLSPSSPESTILLSQRNLQSYAAILWSLFRRRGSRGRRRDVTQLCSLWPTDAPELLETWSDRPVFIWQGTIARIELSLIGPGGAVLWTREVDPDERFVTYTGEIQLQPGTRYKVTYKDAENKTIDFKSFKVLGNSEQRERIITELAALNAENTNINPVELALQRASYFADLELANQKGKQLLLWEDMMRELLAIADTPDGNAFFREQLEQYTTEFCTVD